MFEFDLYWWTTQTLAQIGHLGAWSLVFNQIHATAWKRVIRKTIEKLIYVLVIVLGIYLLSIPSVGNFKTNPFWPRNPANSIYFDCCVVWSFVFIIRWIILKFWDRTTAVKSHSKSTINVNKMVDGDLLHGWQAKALKWIPGNQVVQLSIEHKTLIVPNLPDALVGLRIAHLSDLHFTGKIDKRYFEEVVRQTNSLDADFVCLTGDIVDETECLPWIDEVLGLVKAKQAKLSILGNHDCRIKDEQLVRDKLIAAGWVDVAGGWNSYQINEGIISFAGNEAPWFTRGLATPQRTAENNELLVLLSHSPDQFGWARDREFSLVLAGHTHGGQIRFPIIGPVIAPSHHGVRFASGVFEQRETVMHVSRGISGDDPIRLNCPPELTLISLAKRSHHDD